MHVRSASSSILRAREDLCKKPLITEERLVHESARPLSLAAMMHLATLARDKTMATIQQAQGKNVLGLSWLDD